jgi:hypothetical protein
MPSTVTTGDPPLSDCHVICVHTSLYGLDNEVLRMQQSIEELEPRVQTPTFVVKTD